jgi:light-regulated signal transduction histidine kinase (bacteriophytochrome)
MQLQTLRLMIAEEEYLRSIRETLLGAMHQIRLPLNQINAAVQIMATRNDHQNQPLKALLNQVQEKGEETLVTLQRCVPEIPESTVMSVNFNQLIHEAIRLFSHHFLASSIVIDWQPNLRLPAIMGSENKLRMLLNNSLIMRLML